MTRNVSRRTVLRGVATVGVAGGCVLGVSGTAAAGSCSDFLDAPADFPYIQEGEEFGDFPDDPDELVVFVHGWNTEDVEAAQDQAYTCEDALEAAGYDHPVVAYRWPSDVGWEEGKDNAEEYGQKFAEWLAGYQDDHDATIRVVPHSLGARVSLVAVEEFDEMDRSLTSVSLLGGAVDDESPGLQYRWGEPIETVLDQCYNYHSTNDDILDGIYQTYELDEAVGENGLSKFAKPAANYTDVDESWTVTAHCDYFKRDEGCMDDVVSNW